MNRREVRRATLPVIGRRAHNAAPIVTVNEPPGSVLLPDLRAIVRAREVLYFLTWRDVKVRYKQTALGAAWAILQPLIAMFIFTLFFGRLAKHAVGRRAVPDLRLLRARAVDLLRDGADAGVRAA